jgi:transposase
MNEHLKAISERVAPGAHAALVMDNAGYHLAKELCFPENITPIPLPPYSPELNAMENVWAYLRGNKLALTVFDSQDEIVDKTCEAWNFFANDPERIFSITNREWAQINV